MPKYKKTPKILTEHKSQMIDLMSLIQENVNKARKEHKSIPDIYHIIIDDLYAYLRPFDDKERLDFCVRFINYYENKLKPKYAVSAAINFSILFLKTKKKDYLPDFREGIDNLHPSRGSKHFRLTVDERAANILQIILNNSKLAIVDKNIQQQTPQPQIEQINNDIINKNDAAELNSLIEAQQNEFIDIQVNDENETSFVVPDIIKNENKFEGKDENVSVNLKKQPFDNYHVKNKASKINADNEDEIFMDVSLNDMARKIEGAQEKVIDDMLKYCNYLLEKLRILNVNHFELENSKVYENKQVEIRKIKTNVLSSSLSYGDLYSDIKLDKLIQDSIMLIEIERAIDAEFHNRYKLDKLALDEKKSRIPKPPYKLSYASKMVNSLIAFVNYCIEFKNKIRELIGLDSKETKRKRLLWRTMEDIQPGLINQLESSRSAVEKHEAMHRNNKNTY